MISRDKREVGGWWIWLLVLLVLSLIVFTGLKYTGMIGTTLVERAVFENSFQYSEARKSEIAVFLAQLSEIDIKLSSDLDKITRNNLEAQAASIRIQLSRARSMQ